jgi:hypothetical protein
LQSLPVPSGGSTIPFSMTLTPDGKSLTLTNFSGPFVQSGDLTGQINNKPTPSLADGNYQLIIHGSNIRASNRMTYSKMCG